MKGQVLMCTSEKGRPSLVGKQVSVKGQLLTLVMRNDNQPVHRCRKQDVGLGSPMGDSFRLCSNGGGEQGSPVGGEGWAASLETGGC